MKPIYMCRKCLNLVVHNYHDNQCIIAGCGGPLIQLNANGSTDSVQKMFLSKVGYIRALGYSIDENIDILFREDDSTKRTNDDFSCNLKIVLIFNNECDTDYVRAVDSILQTWNCTHSTPLVFTQFSDEDDGIHLTITLNDTKPLSIVPLEQLREQAYKVEVFLKYAQGLLEDIHENIEGVMRRLKNKKEGQLI